MSENRQLNRADKFLYYLNGFRIDLIQRNLGNNLAPMISRKMSGTDGRTEQENQESCPGVVLPRVKVRLRRDESAPTARKNIFLFF